jgi:hypothetical protein
MSTTSVAAKSYLAAGEYLHGGQCLVSPNGLFYAIQQNDGNLVVCYGSGENDRHGMLWASNVYPGEGSYFAIQQSDGNLVVYRGTGPGDQHEVIWASNVYPGAGDYFTIIQDDGNLVVYRGKSPSQQGAHIWASNVIDPPVNLDATSIDYDMPAAKILGAAQDVLFHTVVPNRTHSTQTVTFTKTESITETSGWADALAVKVGVKASLRAGLPIVADGKVEVSAEVNNTYTWNGSETRSRTWSFSVPVTVAPNTAVSVLVTVTVSPLTVPYRVSGTVTTGKGVVYPGGMNGVYTGSNSYDLYVTFVETDPDTGELAVSERALEPSEVGSVARA